MQSIRLWSIVFSVCALLATAGPAVASVDARYWFWSTTGDAKPLAFSECVRRAPGAIATTGFAANKAASGNPTIYTAGNGSVQVVLNCVLQPRGFHLYLNVATDGSQSASAIGIRISDVFWNRTPSASLPPCASPIGSWDWWNGGTVSFAPNGTATHPVGAVGQWQRAADGSYHVHWGPPLNSDDYFKVSADGKLMLGNYNGNQGTSHRKTACQ
jgi:hypothetical protein